MLSEARALLRIPAVEPPPASAWDRVLVAGLGVLAIAEGSLRTDVPLRPVQIGIGIVFAGTMAIRNARPLLATGIAFGLHAVLTVVEKVCALPPVELHMTACALLLPYALVRRASGRDIVIGHAIFVASAWVVVAFCGGMAELSDYIGGAIVMMFPGALGAAVRFRAETHRRDIEHAKLRERADLARDLHDSVAHHMSAVVIQAQAASAVIATRPEAAARALEAIESEAAHTLADLRRMVRSLREVHGSLEPQLGVVDIPRLARGSSAVHVVLGEGLDQLRPPVQSALYRLAQESITNALRHARGLTRVEVQIAVEGTRVLLKVRDDGAKARGSGSGFGLIGMAERAALLGGTLEAGPSDEGGWRVEASIPKGVDR